MARSKNPFLKVAHEEIQYTENDITEFKRCMDDPIYFICNYCYVQHPKYGEIKFKLYDYQVRMVKAFIDNRLVIMLAPRQVGKSQVMAAYLLWFATFHKDKTILVASNKNSNAMELIHRIKYAYERLPMFLKAGLTEAGWNKHEVGFENGSRILSQATTKDTGRGLSISLLVCDEFAHVKSNEQEAFWTSISPTLSTGGNAIIASTPNGDNDNFAKLWRGANTRSNGYYPVQVYWNENPDRDDDFREKEIAKIGLTKWKQEYECEFLSSDPLLIDTRILSQLTKRLDNIEYFAKSGDVTFWKKPVEDTTYLISLDPSKGTGNDCHAIEVFDFPNLEQVAEFRNNVLSTPLLYALLKKIIKVFEKSGSTVYFTTENNSVGEGIISLYETDENPPDATFITEDGQKFGMLTTNKSKLNSCRSLKELIEKDQMKIKSKVLLEELKNYVRSGGSYAAKAGSTDDCVSCLLLIVRLVSEIAKFDPMAHDKLYHGAYDDCSIFDDAFYDDKEDKYEQDAYDNNIINYPAFYL